MVNCLLFKWEDSPALSHHCGFCERPLSHPGARASCFGTHSEPCHRYHQAMFMRLRGHTCHYCRTIDEAHHHRHKEIAEQLRGVYESCELDWSIVPSEPEERGRARAYQIGLDDSGERDSANTLEYTSSSKREKKDAKCLARAASRSRVITGPEVAYVDSIIHSAEGLPDADSNGSPRNPEEIEEMERHLRYNAHVYNFGNRHELRKLAQFPEVNDLDFDLEMERILGAFRITELLKRNTRNRGLQGKELKAFQTLVEDFKKAVVEDLVLVKKDLLEIRMRRAGYLRYTNKTAHAIVEDRYLEKDWKTGEKYSSNASESSDVMSPAEDGSTPASTPESSSSEESAPFAPASSNDGADRRHLEHIHKRVNGDDGLGQKIIEPYHTPLLPALAMSTPRRPAVQLKVVINTMVKLGTANKPAQKQPRVALSDGWQTVLTSKKPTKPSVKPAWGMTSEGRPVAARPPPVNPWGPDACEIPDLRSVKALEVRSPPVAAVTASNGPECMIDSKDGHPVVSQKKVKKYEREARRKAKKTVSQASSVTDLAEDRDFHGTSKDLEILVVTNRTSPTSAAAREEVALASFAPPLQKPKITKETVDTNFQHAAACEPKVASSTPLTVTSNGRHLHWMRFKRYFIVDQLTDPFLTEGSRCSHGACVFETNNVQNCPFHEPHCACVDPLADLCYLVYPSKGMLSSGPYNRLRGEKLLGMYQKDDRFKGRIMLVDNDVLEYFFTDPVDRMRNRNALDVPKRLATEYDEFEEGYNPGPLMLQEKLFEQLWSKNRLIKDQLSGDLLATTQKHQFEHADTPSFCYCHDNVPESGLPKDIVECSHRDCGIKYFHKSCVKKLGFDKVSRWYCTNCEEEMKFVAHKTLRALGYTDVPDDEAALQSSMDLIKASYDMSDEAIARVRARVAEAGGSSKVVAIVAKALGQMR